MDIIHRFKSSAMFLFISPGEVVQVRIRLMQARQQVVPKILYTTEVLFFLLYTHIFTPLLFLLSFYMLAYPCRARRFHFAHNHLSNIDDGIFIVDRPNPS